MAKYLLDTNICVFALRGQFDVAERLADVGWNNCCISEMTVAELLYGAECSEKAEKNIALIKELCNDIKIMPVFPVLPTYAQIKAALRKSGQLISDIDIFIEATAVHNNMILVTENLTHLNRIPKIKIENWIERK